MFSPAACLSLSVALSRSQYVCLAGWFSLALTVSVIFSLFLFCSGSRHVAYILNPQP